MHGQVLVTVGEVPVAWNDRVWLADISNKRTQSHELLLKSTVSDWYARMTPDGSRMYYVDQLVAQSRIRPNLDMAFVPEKTIWQRVVLDC
jgi:hypothetical protein